MTGATETAGRRIVVTEFVTLDGYMVGPDEDMSWVAAGFDQQMQEDIATDMDNSYDDVRVRAGDLRHLRGVLAARPAVRRG